MKKKKGTGVRGMLRQEKHEHNKYGRVRSAADYEAKGARSMRAW